MTDPRETTQRHDPDEHTPDLGEPDEARGEQRNAADAVMYDGQDVAEGGGDLGPDANELDADNAVEQDTIETLDPDNPPA